MSLRASGGMHLPDALLPGRPGLRPLVPLQTAEAGNLESVLLEYGRGTRGSASAVSSGEDGLVLRQFAETLLELRHGNVDGPLVPAELLDLLRLADVQEVVSPIDMTESMFSVLTRLSSDIAGMFETCCC